VLIPGLLLAQFDFGSQGGGRPWDDFKLNPKTKIKLDFKDANVDMVISLLSRTSGVTIVKDPSLTGPITVTSATAVSLSDAFQILSTVLKLKNFEMAKEGNLLVIRASRRGGAGGGFNMGALSPEQLQQMMSGGSSTELRVYSIEFANATQVARVINDVFSQPQQNPLQQMMQMMQQGQGGGRGQGGGGGGRNQFNQGGRGQQTVRASSDDYSNTVIVNASARDHEQVAKLIRDIDKNIEQPLRPRVFPMTFATAADLVPIVQNVLTANAPKGRGGAGNQQIPIDQRFQQAFRTGSMQAAFGTVVADNYTNSLVVTATEENLALVGEVLKELDTEIVYQASTFVIPLDNARADQMAQLLTQAFGQRQGTGRAGTNTNLNRGATNQFRPNNNNNNRNQGGGGGGFGGGNTEQVDPNNLLLQLVDPDDEISQFETQVGIQGGQFGRLFGGAQGPQGTVGRDAQGRLVNVRDLAGQVTVIPDPNTNSLIVVTGPENEALIRAILEQLDRIPEQVMIETMIIEATLDASTKFGVEWSFAHDRLNGGGGTNFGLQGANPALEGFRYTITAGDLSAFMNLLKTDQRFQVLSTPRIFTSNNVQAEINISQRVPYVLSTREDQNGNLTFTYAFEDVGIILNVTPRITANGIVTMDVTQTANDLQGFTSFNAPIINQRSAQTTVSVKNGETIILGGIIRSTVSSTVKKIPLLGDIPLLGELFKSTSKQNVKTELLVFLTPRIVRTPEEAAALREAEKAKLSGNVKKELDKSNGNGKTDPPKGGGN
jgi:general secretion pathway protein D